MKIDVQAIHFTASQPLLDFIDKKALKLEQHAMNITRAEVFLKIEKPEIEKNKIAEIQVHVPGHTLFAKHECKSFEEAFELSVESLIKQLDKTKRRMRAA